MNLIRCGVPARLRFAAAAAFAAFTAFTALASFTAAARPASASPAALSYTETLDLAERASAAVAAGQAALAGARAAQPAAATLPDPRLAAGLENVPANGADRFSTTRDASTMQRLALMQEVPNRARRDARTRVADARIERERAGIAVATLAARRDAALAWVAVFHAERRLALIELLRRENQIVQDTLPARIAAGQAPPGELAMARQEALDLEDRADDLARDVQRARAELRRFVGARANAPLAGAPQLPALAPDAVRAALHRHAELQPYDAMRAMAAAEMAEAEADRHGDWAWEVAYSRRPRYDDMVSFQLSIDLPWQRDRRQQPTIDAKRQEIARVEAEREETLRRHGADIEAMLAESAALERQLARAQGAALALADERVALATAGYQAARGDLAGVLQARAQRLGVRLRAIELEAQRDALRVRLATLTAE